ncbi:MAG: PLP-dependent transferase [Myxococcales bacterium]|nr:PLP-dependent transferase [Myxococcales bacterium]
MNRPNLARDDPHGACLDHAAFLVWRGAKTLALRTDASQSNARAVAERCDGRRRSRGVLPDDTERGWLAGAGSTLSFVVRGGDASAACVLAELRVVVAATSLSAASVAGVVAANTSIVPPRRARS